MVFCTCLWMQKLWYIQLHQHTISAQALWILQIHEAPILQFQQCSRPTQVDPNTVGLRCEHTITGLHIASGHYAEIRRRDTGLQMPFEVRRETH